MDALIKALMQQLNVNTDQAKGGAGLLFKFAKEKLGDGGFSQVSSKLDGLKALIDSAPDAPSGASLLGGLGSMMGGKAEALGELATLAGGFKKLGLDLDMISKFVPVILGVVQDQGGTEAKNVLSRLFSSVLSQD